MYTDNSGLNLVSGAHALTLHNSAAYSTDLPY
jgi:hypothetical protein